MNDRDRDLIIALIEGSLSGEDAETASARITADPELAAEYEIQRTIHEALTAVEPIAMTADERSGLRADLVDQLNLEEAAPVVVEPSRSRAPSWWMKPALALGSVAAVFVIGVAVVPGMFSGSDDGGDEMVAAAMLTTTTAASMETTEAGDAGGADGADSATPNAGDSAEEESLLQVPELRSTDLDKVLDSVEGETDDDAVAEGIEEFTSAQSTLTVSFDEIEACREMLGNALPNGDFQVIGAVSETGGVIVVTIAFSESNGVDSLATIDLSTCVLVDVAE